MNCSVPAYGYPFWEKLVWPFELLAPSTGNPLGVKPIALPRGNLRGRVIGLVGDLMPLPHEVIARIDDRVTAVLRALDALVVNLEAPVLDAKTYQGPVKGLKLAFSRDLARRALEALGTAPDRTWVSVANNHAADYGPEQFRHTVDDLRSLGYRVMGIWPEMVPMLQLGTLRIGLVPWSYWMNVGWTAPCDSARPVIRTDILGVDLSSEKVTQRLDYLVGYSHWQFEYKHFPRSPFDQLAAQLAGVGMDLNVGGHPHVLGPLVAAGKGLNLCSLGNFVGLHPGWANRLGGILRLCLDPGAAGLSASIDFVPTFMMKGDGSATVTTIDQVPAADRERCTERLALLYPRAT
jgi:poly-gamma-glutamate synthesis protein (capsule biosynthesis protein)